MLKVAKAASGPRPNAEIADPARVTEIGFHHPRAIGRELVLQIR